MLVFQGKRATRQRAGGACEDADVVFVVGTRPEIIKVFPVAKELEERGIEYKVIFTRQHFESCMVDVVKAMDDFGFYDKFETVGDDSSSVFGEIPDIAESIKEADPEIVIVQGDTDSSLAGALACKKFDLAALGHIESGLRSFDTRMPEEINRILIDHMSDLLFCPTHINSITLTCERVRGSIYVTGNTVIDMLSMVLDNLDALLKLLDSDIKDRLRGVGNYFLATIHRRENISEPSLLGGILEFLDRVAEASGTDCLLILHPHTEDKMRKFGMSVESFENIITMRPVSYAELIYIMDNCEFVMTDSGGLQEESNFLERPCVTVRESTERIETVAQGTNLIIRPKNVLRDIDACVDKVIRFLGSDLEFDRYIYGDGSSGKIISDIVEEFIQHHA